MVLFIVVESFVGSLAWSSSSVVCSAALIVVDAVDSCVDDFSMLFVLPSGGFDFLLLLNHCNECCVTRAVVVVVMLTGYLPKMQSKHFYKADNDDWNRQLFRQDSPSNSFNWSA